jgi:hypothetical protein
VKVWEARVRSRGSPLPSTQQRSRFGAMLSLREEVDDAAVRTGFWGAVRVDVSGHTEVDAAYGEADRAHRISNTVG